MKKLFLALSVISMAGCMKIGPRNLREDSLQYNHAVRNSVDKQLLLNMVRLRYRDNPTFLQVGIITSSYEFKRALGIDGKFDFKAKDQDLNFEGWSATPKAAVEYNEKPTITFSPVRGEAFSKEMLSPVSMGHIMLLHTSGWKIDRILRTTVQRINNLRNAQSASGPTPKMEPVYEGFLELVKILRKLELADEMRIVTEKDPATNKIYFFMLFDESAKESADLQRVWELLDLAPGTFRVRMVPYHGKEHGPNDMTIDTRSPLSTLYFLSQSVQAPYQDEAWGRVTVTEDQAGGRFDWDNVLGGLMCIRSSTDPEICNVAVSVCYRGTRFYIDDSDLDSKSTFQMLTQLLALQTNCPELPVYTLPLRD